MEETSQDAKEAIEWQLMQLPMLPATEHIPESVQMRKANRRVRRMPTDMRRRYRQALKNQLNVHAADDDQQFGALYGARTMLDDVEEAVELDDTGNKSRKPQKQGRQPTRDEREFVRLRPLGC